jgi:gluconokinase
MPTAGPWLDALGAWLAEQPGGGVIACSALKRSYRDRLRHHVPALRILHAQGEPALIAARQAARAGHFMPPTLMASQFATLEPCAPDEAALVLDVTLPPEALIGHALAWLSAVAPLGSPRWEAELTPPRNEEHPHGAVRRYQGQA